jgi:hypothetical protein
MTWTELSCRKDANKTPIVFTCLSNEDFKKITPTSFLKGGRIIREEWNKN